ncbi:hypothetical protein RclHR1_01990023 [Rhizophagus clarus]|uniref:Secreted peptidase family S41 n=1 Tax=Rhizophagus clarus TaxID=94130 RepID=A0A2Z6R5L3_9GLOM|nr:hypothetical protein RclHR1_01990023 [Rhizophagus clarus]GES72981.1 secreted peptidase family S41 [Rhizophagus clarus]
MKTSTIIKALIPSLMLLATHRGESLYIPRDDSSPAPTTGGQDGCANIHNTFKGGANSFSFSDIKACYESFAFDDKRRSDTIDTMKKLFNGFYVFTDQAKEQPPQGLDYKAIDIVAEIDNLSQKTYANDLEFSTDATNLVTQMKDPHTIYFPICYTRFAFTQRLALYATASQDGTHTIKIFKDSIESQNDDCEVVNIDGVAAIDAITQFARDNVFVSKDLGVRFNMALASLALQNGTYILQPRSSQFTLRMVLPDKETTTYDLKCGTNTKTITRNWEGVINNPDDLNKFTDANSYWENFCANPPADEKNQPQQPKSPSDVQPVRNVGKEPVAASTTSTSRKNKRTKSKAKKSNEHSCNVAYPIDPLTVNPDLLKSLSPSVNIDKLAFDAKIAQFYMLDNNVGAAVLATYDIGNEVSVDSLLNTFSNLQTGFKKLADNGAKKLVLDMSNNEGGLTVISHFVNALLFPNTNPSMPTDFRLNDIVKGAILKATNDSNSIFNFGGYLTVDEKEFNDVNEFLASKFIDNDISDINGFFTASQSSFPWKSSDMIMLTNGYCGSACSSTSLLFAELHGVKSVAVGGFPNTQLSFSSFPGGQAFVLDDPLKRGFDLKTDFNSLGLDNEPDFPKDMPTNTVLTFTVRKAFSTINPDQVLEYSFIPSTNHIFFDESSIRDPSKLWTQASTFI